MPEVPLARAVSAVLRGQAAKARMENRELAARVGMSPFKVGRLLTGKTVIGFDDADILCHALGIDLVAVLREAMDDTPDRPRRRLTVDERLSEGF